jgi:hypothetical protein
MLEMLMRLYVMALAYDVRSPMPHLVGPPGSGKSSVIEALAEQLDVNLHVINVSRLSPLEVEGVMMPMGEAEEMVLKMLPATFWTSLKEGDVLLMDEFLRGFPEVYSSLLDIFTSRRVGAYRLPKVFIVGASNSVIAYDFALEDRLLHIPVPDPRKNQAERKRLATILVEDLGLDPSMVDSMEMSSLLDTEVLPTFDVLDVFKKRGTKVTSTEKGRSLRNLIGQAQLRQVQSTQLVDLIEANNQHAVSKGLWQYVLLLNGKNPPSGYIKAAVPLQGNDKLTRVQSINLDMNLELIGLEDEKKKEDTP